MLKVSPTGRLTSDAQGEYTDIDRHFRARSKNNFALTFAALPMSQSLQDDESLLSDAASDSVVANLSHVPATPASSPSSSSSESSDSDEGEESSSSSSSSSEKKGSKKEKKKKKKKDKKSKKTKKTDRIKDDELADLQEGVRRVASITKTPDVDMNALFDPVRAETIRKSLNLHGRVDKIPVLTALAGRMASQAESATGRPARVHGRVANGRIAEVVTGAGALERMVDVTQELEKPKKKKKRNKKKKKNSCGDEEEDSGISLGSQDSADDEEDVKMDEGEFSSFIASSDEMDEVSDSDKSVVISSEESDSDSGSESSSSGSESDSDESSSSSSSSSSESSSSSDHKHKKHKKDKKKKKKKDTKKSKDKHKKDKKKEDKKTKKKKHDKDKEEKSKKSKKEDAKKVTKKEKEEPSTSEKKDSKPAVPAPSAKAAAKPTPNAAGLKKPLVMPVFALKPSSSAPVTTPSKAAAPAPFPKATPPPPPPAASKKSSKTSKSKNGATFEVSDFLNKIMPAVASSSDSDDENDETQAAPAAPASNGSSSSSSSSNGKTTAVEVPTTVSTKVGFSETYFSSVAMLALTKIAPLFVPTLEATYDLCGKYSPGLLKKIRMHEERAVDAGLSPTESDYATVEAQTARHLAFMLISLEPNAQNRLVHKAIDIACATDSGIKGPVPSMHTYPSNTMHRHFVDTLITALCRTSDSMARAYSAIYSGMRAQDTPVAQLAVDLMHARNVTLLSKDVPLPAGLSQTYVCAVSGTAIAPGELVNLYRITKRGPYEGEGWVDPRPWETDHLRQHSYVFATRSMIAGNKIILPFGNIVETPLVVIKPPLDTEPASKATKRPREEEKEGEEKEGTTKPTPSLERPEKRPRLDPVPIAETPKASPVVDNPDAMDIDTPPAPSKAVDEAVRYVKLYPVKGSIYEGDKVLRVGPLFTLLDKERRNAFHGGRESGSSGGGGASDSVMSAMGLDMFSASATPASNIPAKLQASIDAMRAAQTPAQMGAALGKAVTGKEAVWAVICLVQELTGDVSEVPSVEQAAEAAPAMDAFGELFGVPPETTSTDATASPYVEAPDGTTVKLAVWGLLLYMGEAMSKSPAIGGSADFKRVRDAIKAFAKDSKRNGRVFDLYKDAMLLLIEAGTPLARADDA